MGNKDTQLHKIFTHRADSFTDDAELMMEIDGVDAASDDDVDAVIQCICGFGKGFDDDDAVSCDKCGTWQHILCYFENQALPKDDDTYLCVSCQPRDIDAIGATLRMQKKLSRLTTISKQIYELEQHLLGWDEVLQDLAVEKLHLEERLQYQDEISTTTDFLEWLGDVEERYSVVQAAVAETFQERQLTLESLTRLAGESNRTRCNERVMILDEQAERAPQPLLYTTACSLGSRAAVPHTLPPIKLAPHQVKLKGKKR